MSFLKVCGKVNNVNALDRNSPVPLYYQLYTILLKDINDGVFKPGDMLPTEVALMQQYSVSRATVRQAMQVLVQKGYVIVLEIIVEDAGKLYTAFLAVRNDCVEAYTGMTEYVDVYQALPKDSLLWSVGALLEQDRPPLWMKYIEYLIYQRQCALEDMTEKLSHIDKYQDLEQEVNFLRNLL